MTPLNTFLKDIQVIEESINDYVGILEEEDQYVNNPQVKSQENKRVSKYFMKRSDFDRHIESGVITWNKMHDDGGGDVRIGTNIPANAVYFEGDVVYFEGEIVIN